MRHRIAVMFQVAFDESGTHDKNLLTVAAYVAPDEQWLRFADEWNEVLPQELAPFHAKEFFNWVKATRAHPLGQEIRDRLWGAIIRRVNRGFQVSMSIADYERIVAPRQRSMFGAAYTMCVHECLREIEAWADCYGYNEPVAYFFEIGHPNLEQVKNHMGQFAACPEIRRRFRIGSVTEAGKSGPAAFVPLQAADMLAHQVNRFLRAERKNKIVPAYERRFREMLPDQLTVCDEARIRLMVQTMGETERQVKAARRAMWMRRPHPPESMS
jgi:hypothetical protein